MITVEKIQGLVQNEIKNIPYPSSPFELYEPISYVLEGSGKRLRPLLVLLAYNLYKNDIKFALKPAIGVEMFHNFTLLHDDIMDKANIRRNKPTVHKKWNENVAILSGDAMMIKSYQFFFDLPGNIQTEVLKTFTQTALEVCEGQQFDMNFETRTNVTLEEYMNMIRLKTAVLIAASLKIGAQIAQAPAEDIQRLYDFGILVGLAFQLQDDYLDTFGNVKTFGKNIGGDIVSNKKTFLLISALEKGNNQQKNQLIKTLSDKNIHSGKKIETVTSLYNEIGIPGFTLNYVHELIQKGLNLLEILSVTSKTSILKTLIINLLNRNN
jgi:geranylgeranyl diphosphate synthase type II